ncbi:MAG TPA: type II toxin-antitoxin system RelE/ParE family toxin [Pyrinomonadaceae bacterium]|nr:type II toxin-antitoxin system RelE/ParE family toxin [Pyrinomonadaceae bacterium]
MAEIVWTAEAQIWLRDIYDYIAVDNPEAAARTALGIFQKTQLLKSHPYIGQRYEFGDPREVRILLYLHYRIAYLLKPDNNIDILGIFHGALDIERYLV